MEWPAGLLPALLNLSIIILQSFARFEQVNTTFDWNSDFMCSVFGVLRYLASIRATLSVWKAEHSSI